MPAGDQNAGKEEGEKERLQTLLSLLFFITLISNFLEVGVLWLEKRRQEKSVGVVLARLPASVAAVLVKNAAEAARR